MSTYAAGEDVDHGWTLYAGTLVFYMHAGFSLLEAGYVQRKNQQSILVKNLCALCIGAIGWFLFGFGIAFGQDSREIPKTEPKAYGGGFIGTTMTWTDEDTLRGGKTGLKDTLAEQQYATSQHNNWWFQFTFCATAATIVSGGLAERCTLHAFAFIAFYMTAFVYPVVVHWTWGGGLLGHIGVGDFAGSGVVHLVGGVAALVGTAVMGPRKGRFGENAVDIEHSSMMLVTLGTFILWFGWYGFNAGSTAGLVGQSVTVARCMINTTLSASAGGLTLFVAESFRQKKYDVSAFCNGVLAGLVSITAGCNCIDPAVSIVVGIIGALCCQGAALLLEKLQIDDPIGAFPVHGACGLWGLLAVGFFDFGAAGAGANQRPGVFYGGEATQRFTPNLAMMGLVPLWVAGMTLPAFFGLKFAGVLRYSEEVETVGIDSQFVFKGTLGSAHAEHGSKSGF